MDVDTRGSWTPPASGRRSDRVRTYREGRVCAEPGCTTLLSVYNASPRCALHQRQAAIVRFRRLETVEVRRHCHHCRRGVRDHEPPAQVLQLPVPLARLRGAREGDEAHPASRGDGPAGGLSAATDGRPRPPRGSPAAGRSASLCAWTTILTPPSNAGAPPASSGTSTATPCCRCGSPTWTSPRRRRWSRRWRLASPTGSSATRSPTDSLLEAIVAHLERRYGWRIEREWICWLPRNRARAHHVLRSVRGAR